MAASWPVLLQLRAKGRRQLNSIPLHELGWRIHASPALEASGACSNALSLTLSQRAFLCEPYVSHGGNGMTKCRSLETNVSIPWCVLSKIVHVYCEYCYITILSGVVSIIDIYCCCSLSQNLEYPTFTTFTGLGNLSIFENNYDSTQKPPISWFLAASPSGLSAQLLVEPLRKPASKLRISLSHFGGCLRLLQRAWPIVVRMIQFDMSGSCLTTVDATTELHEHLGYARMSRRGGCSDAETQDYGNMKQTRENRSSLQIRAS
jgi:hypothetical protein